MKSALVLLTNDPPPSLPAREPMAFIPATHMTLVPLGVAMLFFITSLLMHHWILCKDDAVVPRPARRRSAVMAVQFGVGIVSGTVPTFEFGLPWPNVMGRWGDVFGLRFAVEAWAFFPDAILTAIHRYGWRRRMPRTHFRLATRLPLGALTGAFGNIAASSWMNAPHGSTLNSSGKPTGVDVGQAMFAPMFGPAAFGTRGIAPPTGPADRSALGSTR